MRERLPFAAGGVSSGSNFGLDSANQPKPTAQNGKKQASSRPDRPFAFVEVLPGG